MKKEDEIWGEGGIRREGEKSLQHRQKNWMQVVVGEKVEVEQEQSETGGESEGGQPAIAMELMGCSLLVWE